MCIEEREIQGLREKMRWRERESGGEREREMVMLGKKKR